jgi:putative addiction module component (TIGR02574 family)
MEREVSELLEKAIHLPKEARAALADLVLESLDGESDEDAEDAWRQEIGRRLLEIDSGAVKLVPWRDARERLLSHMK